jgi:hypothetical protein
MLCDTSFLVPLFVQEPSSDRVTARIEDWPDAPIVSDFAMGEFASAVSIRMRRSDLSDMDARDILSDFDLWVNRMTRRAALQTYDVLQAGQIVRRFDLALRMPAALHIAIAQRLSEPLATRDQRQAHAAVTLGLRVIEPEASKSF